MNDVKGRSLEFVVVLVFAHHFIGENPRRNNGENEQSDYYEKWPPGNYVHNFYILGS